MTNKEALSVAVTALMILATKECSDKLTPTLKKKCEELREKSKKAVEIVKELYVKEES